MAGAEDRRAWITEQVLTEGTVEITSIIDRFGISRMTAHRDLDELSRQGVLRKERGGASMLPSTLFESDVRYRVTQQRAAKEELCAAAAAWIESGMAVLVDEATTTLPLLGEFAARAPLTVLSNFRKVWEHAPASAWNDIELVALGGRYHRRFDSFTGPLCVSQVQGMRADLYISSTTAVGEGIAWHPDADISATKRAMLGAAATRLLLVDRTKLRRTALHRIAPLSEFDAVLVDSSATDDAIQQLRSAGAKVHRADDLAARSGGVSPPDEGESGG